MDVNELDYQISWTPLSSEDGCEGYQAYIQTYDGDQPGRPENWGELVKAGTQTDGTYKERLFLDESLCRKNGCDLSGLQKRIPPVIIWTVKMVLRIS